MIEIIVLLRAEVGVKSRNGLVQLDWQACAMLCPEQLSLPHDKYWMPPSSRRPGETERRTATSSSFNLPASTDGRSPEEAQSKGLLWRTQEKPLAKTGTISQLNCIYKLKTGCFLLLRFTCNSAKGHGCVLQSLGTTAKEMGFRWTLCIEYGTKMSNIKLWRFQGRVNQVHRAVIWAKLTVLPLHVNAQVFALLDLVRVLSD